MNAIDILSRCRSAIKDIQRYDDKLTRLRECAASCTSHVGTGGGRASGHDKMSAFTGEIDDCERMKVQRRREYEVEMLAACKLVELLPPTECGILYRYYVSGQTAEGIAESQGYSVRYVKQKKQIGERIVRGFPEKEVERLLPLWYVDQFADEEREDRGGVHGKW